MSRRYDGSRRAEAAQRTREQILAAAFRLHGEGVLDTEVLAQEANVSLATVRKHFPTRESLFENCTAYGMQFVPMPDLAAIARAQDPAERTELAVREVYSLHESLLGQEWTAFKHEQDSPALAAVLRQIEGAVEEGADRVLAAWPATPAAPDVPRGLLVGMLSPLTYRALRIHGGLSPSEAVAQAASVITSALSSSVSGEEARTTSAS